MIHLTLLLKQQGDFITQQKCHQSSIETRQIVRGTGTLSHGLGLRSVHNHDHGPEMVTTFQSQWVNVDYVLYSTLPATSAPSSDGRREGRLKLLGRLSLPTAQQMALVGRIPNTHCPSDHLPLLADFLL